MPGPAFLFTGQGSQFVGMGLEFFNAFDEVRALLQDADQALGEELTRLMHEGPEEKLTLTVNTQPAVLALDVAVFKVLAVTPDVAAGHSLGEYAALVAAGALDFKEAVRLVRIRAKAMQEAVPLGKGGMVVLRKCTRQDAERIASQVESGVIELANLNCPGQYVLSGETPAIQEVIEKVGSRRALKLPVSVPFHSSLLAEAAKEFARHLEDVEIKDPAFPIISNVDAKPVTTAVQVKDSLARQFDNPVLWEPSMELLLEQGYRTFVECGPKPTLVRMVQAVGRDKDVDGICVHCPSKPEDLEQVRSALNG